MTEAMSEKNEFQAALEWVEYTKAGTETNLRYHQRHDHMGDVITCRDRLGYLDTIRKSLEFMAANHEAVRKGYVLVPAMRDGKAGLTPEMHEAFWKRYDEAGQRHGHFEATNAGYNAMIAAAKLSQGD